MEVLKWIGIALVVGLALFGLFVLVGSVFVLFDKDDEDDDFGDLDDARDVRSIAAQLELEHDWWNMTVEALEALPAFADAVASLAAEETDVDAIVTLSHDANGWVAAMALAALVERDDVPTDWIAWAQRNPVRPSVCEDRLLLRALATHAEHPVIAAVLPATLGTLRDDVVAEFVESRIGGGEVVDETTFDLVPIDKADELEAFLDRFEPDLGPDVRPSFERWRALRTLRAAGRIWNRPFDDPPALLVGRRRELVEIAVAALEQNPARSVLLTGEHGVGKTALARSALERLDPEVVVFETTAAQLNAGAIYIGELEGRVKTLVDAVAGQRVVWIVPELQETLFAGQHSRSPQGLLDALLPHIESGAITLLAEITPSAAELVIAARPRVKSAFEVVRVRPLDDAAAIAVARHALEHDALEVEADDETLAEALELAQQFLPGVAQPGNLLRLVHATAAEAAEDEQDHFDASDALTTIAASSGLPLALLDAGAPLPLDEVRTFFARRVLEQREAVDCVVERIAMIKAGVTDPTRPFGVFLFVGPTGTGKTEIAKALAEFLFGSPERLIRLDMSEYQTQESFDRLLSDTVIDGHGATLISSVRKDPFAVILLDEFEKAAQPVRDIFLQVFDDGRLTDLQGREVDFRRCVIVLTSNLGSPLAEAPRVGFDPSGATFSSAGIERAVRASFRPELVNRFDRVVVFRPFERAAMRALLDKELADALDRRGLRGRPWAVEVDESAYAFLIDKGFSPELGARPLKRAVEQYLLAPLARAIVEQSVPDGDQFLFVTAPSGERIHVAFVDPDDEPEIEADTEPSALDLKHLARAPRGDGDSVRVALAELARISAAVADAQTRKGHVLSTMSEPGFWERDDRFELLAEAEYLERMQVATRTAERLGTRLQRSTKGDGRANPRLVGLLAGRLYVLDRALAGVTNRSSTEVVISLRRSGVARGDEGVGEEFAAVLTEMYMAWADRRGMSAELLDAGAGRRRLAISGLGCGEILGLEAGLHVLEHVGEAADRGQIVDRDQVQVIVSGNAPGAPESTEAAGASKVVVRRYRPGKSPLVRDSVRGYRTGRLDLVLGGDFDLF